MKNVGDLLMGNNSCVYWLNDFDNFVDFCGFVLHMYMEDNYNETYLHMYMEDNCVVWYGFLKRVKILFKYATVNLADFGVQLMFLLFCSIKKKCLFGSF